MAGQGWPMTRNPMGFWGGVKIGTCGVMKKDVRGPDWFPRKPTVCYVPIPVMNIWPTGDAKALKSLTPRDSRQGRRRATWWSPHSWSWWSENAKAHETGQKFRIHTLNASNQVHLLFFIKVDNVVKCHLEANLYCSLNSYLWYNMKLNTFM